MNNELIDNIQLADEAEDLLWEGYFYNGFLDGLREMGKEEVSFPRETLKTLFQKAYNMYAYFDQFDGDLSKPKFKFWYENWEEEPSDFTRIGKVIGRLVGKDFSVIEDICNCTDEFFLGDPLTCEDPKDFKAYLEKTKPNWGGQEE